MREGNFRRVQENACRRGAAVKRVAENREAAFRRVDADLMRAASQRFRLQADVAADVKRLHLIADCRLPIADFSLSLVTSAATKFRFRDFAAGAGGVFFAGADERGFDRDFFRRHGAIGEQEIFFADTAGGELFRERAIGQRRFAKDEDAAGFLVEPVKNGERGPTRFAMFEPVVDAFAGIRRRRVRVPAGGLVNHQQMFVLKNYARNHAP